MLSLNAFIWLKAAHFGQEETLLTCTTTNNTVCQYTLYISTENRDEKRL